MIPRIYTKYGKDRTGYISLTCILFLATVLPPRSRPPQLKPETPQNLPGSSAAAALNALLPPLVSIHDSVKTWDDKGKPSLHFTSGDGRINAVQSGISNGRSMLITGGQSGMIHIWNPADGSREDINSYGHGEVDSLALSQDKSLIAAGYSDGHITITRLADLKLLTDIQANSQAIRALVFTKDRNNLIGGSADGVIRIWSVAQKGKLLSFRGDIIAHESSINGISLSPNGGILASVSQDGTLKTWDYMQGALNFRVDVCKKGVNAASYSPDGNTIATGDSSGRVQLYNAATGGQIPFLGNRSEPILCLLWSNDGTTLAAGDADNTITYWNISTGRQLACIAAHDGPVRGLSAAP